MYDAKSPEFSFSLDETTDVGRDTGAPVSGDYKAGDNAFNGTVNWVKVDTAPDHHRIWSIRRTCFTLR